MSRKNKLKAVAPSETENRIPKRVPVPTQPPTDPNRHFVLTEAQLDGIIRTYSALPAPLQQKRAFLQTFMGLPSVQDFLHQLVRESRATETDKAPETPLKALEHANGGPAKVGG